MKWATRVIISCIILLIFFAVAEVARSPRGIKGTQIFFLSVGQGDAELIQKDNVQILIDGGPDDTVLQELGKVMPLTDRKIEYVVLTHPHADHLVGLNSILDRYEVGAIYGTGIIHTSDSYLLFLQKIKDKHIKYVVPEVYEDVIPFENSKLSFLWPGKNYSEKSIENLNNSSEVTRFCYFDHCSVFMGDAEIEEQTEMFNYYTQNKPDFDWHSSILKVAHHGSINGTNEVTYEKVLPTYSVIEVGTDNKYGHPHAAMLDIANKYRSQVLRTDRDGTIQFVIAEEGITQVK